MTNLTQKFIALQEQLSAMQAELVQELAAMRGAGPDNTIYSINRSLWNLAGPAPGTSLTDIKNAISSVGNPELVQKVIDTLGDPSATAPIGYTVRQLLSELLQQFDHAAANPTMKDLLMQIAASTQLALQSPLMAVPDGLCASPLVSNAVAYSKASATLVEPQAYAIFPSVVPYGFDIEVDSTLGDKDKLSSGNWTQYKIWVASTAEFWSYDVLNTQQFRTNEWVTVAGSMTLRFIVPGAHDIKVYICKAGGADASCPGAEGFPVATVGWQEIPKVAGQTGTGYSALWSASAGDIVLTSISPGFQEQGLKLGSSGVKYLCMATAVTTPFNLAGGGSATFWEFRTGQGGLYHNGGLEIPVVTVAGVHTATGHITVDDTSVLVLRTWVPDDNASSPQFELTVDLIKGV